MTPADALYRTALSASCRCVTKWGNGGRVLVTQCQRCQALVAWEASQGLPPTTRIADYLPLAKEA